MRNINESDVKQAKAKNPDWWLSLAPVFQAMFYFCLFVLHFLVFVAVLLSGPKLRYFYVPALVLYLVVVLVEGYWVVTRVERLKEREIFGDDWYFQEYPLERYRFRLFQLYRDWRLRHTPVRKENREKQ